MALTKKQKAALNMATFLKSQSLDLLGKLEELDLDEQSELCDRLHEQASELLKSLCLRLNSTED
jgi:hypothetical protein